jgi:hypothetical protein
MDRVSFWSIIGVPKLLEHKEDTMRRQGCGTDGQERFQGSASMKARVKACSEVCDL